MSGEVILDAVGDREPDYWITDMAPNGTFIKIAEVLNLRVNERVSLTTSHVLYQVCFDCACRAIYPRENCATIHVCEGTVYTWIYV